MVGTGVGLGDPDHQVFRSLVPHGAHSLELHAVDQFLPTASDIPVPLDLSSAPRPPTAERAAGPALRDPGLYLLPASRSDGHGDFVEVGQRKRRRRGRRWRHRWRRRSRGAGGPRSPQRATRGLLGLALGGVQILHHQPQDLLALVLRAVVLQVELVVLVVRPPPYVHAHSLQVDAHFLGSAAEEE